MVPGERERTIHLLKEAMEGGLPDIADSHLLLGALLELEGDDAAHEEIERAEALWDGPAEEFAAELRNTRDVLNHNF